MLSTFDMDITALVLQEIELSDSDDDDDEEEAKEKKIQDQVTRAGDNNVDTNTEGKHQRPSLVRKGSILKRSGSKLRSGLLL